MKLVVIGLLSLLSFSDVAYANGCPPGQYDHLNTSVCTNCTIGHWCPGDGTQHECPDGWRTVPATSATTDTACAVPACGNGALEGAEECDDGNNFIGDGCDAQCKFEDSCNCAAGSEWVCTTPEFFKSSCCPSRTNPITSDFVCNCAGQASDYVVDPCKRLHSDKYFSSLMLYYANYVF